MSKKEYQDEYRKKNREKAAAVSRAWYHQNKARYRNNQLKKLYGIDIETYSSILQKQCGVCAICGSSPKEGRPYSLHVDHDHSTGNVRGLLCNMCNVGIGTFKESKDLIFKAYKYLILSELPL